MKLVMTQLRKDGTILSTDAIIFNSNKFNRVNAPHLSNENICQLKRHKEIEIETENGKLIYALLDK